MGLLGHRIFKDFYDLFAIIDSKIYIIKSTGYSCDLLHEAFKRYKGLLFLKAKKTSRWPKMLSKNEVIGTLKELNVKLISPCEDYPSLNMDEKC